MTRDHALFRLFDAMAYLAYVQREEDPHQRWGIAAAGQSLINLTDHHSPAVSAAARKACLRFGINRPVLVSMGDSA